ncbi:MAG: hypothetical protein IPI87_18110 [Betaproteobacteria bacterium]|nr:hypothetical protein [Betaproteobacteria bacterium]
MRTWGWRTGIAAIVFVAACGVEAALVHWQLEGVTFEDGTTATGTITYDDSSARIVLWNIRTRPGAGLLPFTYLPGDSTADLVAIPPATPGNRYVFRSVEGGRPADPPAPAASRLLILSPAERLSSGAGFLPLDFASALLAAGNVECLDCAVVRQVVSGGLRRVASSPPIAKVEAVEFYNAGFDHYFLTADPAEIAALDGGTFAGWTRTGQGFTAYAAGSYNGGTVRPVCRFYGLPSAGLDSHFYSASPAECFEVDQRFGAEWRIESDNVFQVDLPDTVTGVCAGGTIPVYRMFNGRPDVNHRYTTSAAIRATMEAAGWIREGYGPGATIMCALP